MWKILETDFFRDWFSNQDTGAQGAIVEAVKVLHDYGPQLGRPKVDTLEGSKHPNMKELRIQSNGRPFRVFFAFDPKRQGVLLIGGNKKGDKNFYKRLIPKADQLFSEYLEENYEKEK